MLKYNNKNKKAQIGETLSWVVATLVIIGILLIFIYISVLMSKVKIISVGNVKTDLEKESQILNMKTSLSHKLVNNENKDIIDNLLKENG